MAFMVCFVFLLDGERELLLTFCAMAFMKTVRLVLGDFCGLLYSYLGPEGLSNITAYALLSSIFEGVGLSFEGMQATSYGKLNCILMQLCNL